MRTAAAALLALLLVISLARQGRAEEAAPAPAAQPPAAAPAAAPEPEMSADDKADYEAGKKAAQEIEKQVKVIDDSPDLPRLQAIADRLRPYTQKPNQRYTIKVVDEGAINAFSLPGGFIYVTKGLLGAVESDDELAAVMAHEMAHVALNHSRRLQDKDAQFNRVLGGIILAAVLGQKSGVNAGEVATVAAFVKMDRVNHYGRAAELEADSAAVGYLQASGTYHPVAMLTVLEGLARMEANSPTVDMGVMQTHPLAVERVEATKRTLMERHIPLERARVTKYPTAAATAVTKSGREIAELRFGDHVLFQPAAEVEGVSPLARAQQGAEVVNEQMLADLSLLDIASMPQGSAVAIEARGKTLFTITPEDAAFHQSTVDALARQALDGFRAAFYEVRVKRAF
jgi:predicted Zn-dependent protease